MDGVNSMCKVCMNKYIKDYMKNRIKTDVSFQLIRNTRRRIHHAPKSSSTRDIPGIDFETYRRWIEWQMNPEMNWNNIEIDHVKPICMFDVSKDGELRKAFCWKSTQPLPQKIINIKNKVQIF